MSNKLLDATGLDHLIRKLDSRYKNANQDIDLSVDESAVVFDTDINEVEIQKEGWTNLLKVFDDGTEGYLNIYAGSVNEDGFCEWNIPASPETAYDWYAHPIKTNYPSSVHNSIKIKAGSIAGFFGGQVIESGNYITSFRWTAYSTDDTCLGQTEINTISWDSDKHYVISWGDLEIPITTPGIVSELRFELKIHHPVEGILSMSLPNLNTLYYITDTISEGSDT